MKQPYTIFQPEFTGEDEGIMQKSIFKKGLVVGIILLFVGTSMLPSVSSKSDRYCNLEYESMLFEKTTSYLVRWQETAKNILYNHPGQPLIFGWQWFGFVRINLTLYGETLVNYFFSSSSNKNIWIFPMIVVTKTTNESMPIAKVIIDPIIGAPIELTYFREIFIYMGSGLFNVTTNLEAGHNSNGGYIKGITYFAALW